MNWFDGICATLCGTWMALSAITQLPLSWNDLMPVELLEPLPLPSFMEADFFWPGVALVIANGMPNIIALALRFKGDVSTSYSWGVAAGALLVCWTAFELLYIPNTVSALYLLLGILQIVASWNARRQCFRTA